MFNVSYRIAINPAYWLDITQIVKTHGFKADKAMPENLSHTPLSQSMPVTIVCEKVYHPKDMGNALDLFHILKTETGVKNITPMFSHIKSKTPLIGMTISSTITFFTILGVIHLIVPEMVVENMLIASFIPAMTNFLIQLGYTYFRMDL